MRRNRDRELRQPERKGESSGLYAERLCSWPGFDVEEFENWLVVGAQYRRGVDTSMEHAVMVAAKRLAADSRTGWSARRGPVLATLLTRLAAGGWARARVSRETCDGTTDQKALP